MTLHWKDPNKLLLKLLQQTVYKEIIVYNNKSLVPRMEETFACPGKEISLR